MSPVSIAPSPVKLAEIFPPDAILMGLEVRNKVNVIEKMVRHAVARGDVLQTAEDGLVSLFHEREKLGTTALGNGIAFPHCESSFTKRFVGVAGFLSSPIPFDAVDGEPVDSVFLVLAPPDRRERFLQILGRLVAFGRDRRLRVLLRRVSNGQARLVLPPGARPARPRRSPGSWDRSRSSRTRGPTPGLGSGAIASKEGDQPISHRQGVSVTRHSHGPRPTTSRLRCRKPGTEHDRVVADEVLMKTCDQLIDYLVRHIVGTLGDVEAANFHHHLQGCISCCARHRTLRQMIRAIGGRMPNLRRLSRGPRPRDGRQQAVREPGCVWPGRRMPT